MTITTKLNDYVVRLEWTDAIAYVDVAVRAVDPASACVEAFENVDYDAQKTYDDSAGSTYVGSIVPVASRKAARLMIERDDTLSHALGHAVPLQHQSDGERLATVQDAARIMLAAMLYSRAAESMPADHACRLEAADKIARAIATAEAAGIAPVAWSV